ncbi:hypothetical protein DQ384_37350 [Sphaerisporangium album]|uniref:Uncharacterized protein n=2 Tax=Sphaerisporangium album TaxID=509200 RepID=A0A367ESL9_9ACTN|nr:hypothetical protein DQ384_37350 [Sphaerisporangium album]
MRSAVRTGWIIVGGALSALAVFGIAFAIWNDLRLPGAYGLGARSYDSADLGRVTTEISTVAYAITAPLIVVDADGPVEVRVARGAEGRLTIRREVTWRETDREFSESWGGGTTLRVRLACRPGPDGPACGAVYTLSVPPTVRVRMVAPDGLVTCPLPAATTAPVPTPSPKPSASRRPSPAASVPLRPSAPPAPAEPSASSCRGGVQASPGDVAGP